MQTERRAQIENGVVVNVAEVAVGAVPDHMADWPLTETAGPGWLYDGTAFSPPPPPPVTNAHVNRERDRRLALGTEVTPTGHGQAVAVNSLDEGNLTGLATLAVAQAAAGNGSATVQWRDNNDVLHTLTYDQVIEMHGLAAAYKQAVYAASWTLKDSDPIPADYTDDTHWP